MSSNSALKMVLPDCDLPNSLTVLTPGINEEKNNKIKKLMKRDFIPFTILVPKDSLMKVYF